jgi:capsule polysaccharide export protein KpsE/RkpR
MDIWRTIADRKIEEAVAEGQFDNLRNHGKPLDLTDKPFEDPSIRLAHELLRNNGVSLPWIEERRALEVSITAVKQQLDREREKTGQAGKRLANRAAELNRQIAAYNLKAPSPRFHLLPIEI